jgi:peptidoglycan/xylan/chitin deacetylase (PgdA/CDA1 family)
MKILMYHDIRGKEPTPCSCRTLGAGLYDVEEENFRRQMEFLRTHGWQPVKIDAPDAAAPKNVILTFDDGESGNFNFALPILKRMGYPAYFFILVDRIGTPRHMGWEELRQMLSAGMVIGSHALSHRILTSLTIDEVERELRESKHILEQNLAMAIEDLSIPRGFYNWAILNIAKQIGYKSIFVSDLLPGTGGNCIPRIAVKRDWTLKRFEMALAGKVPTGERLLTSAKNFGKQLLGTSGYDRARGKILRWMGR